MIHCMHNLWHCNCPLIECLANYLQADDCLDRHFSSLKVFCDVLTYKCIKMHKNTRTGKKPYEGCKSLNIAGGAVLC